MLINTDKRICFLANPKTASAAMGHTLLSLDFQTMGGQHCTPPQSSWRHWPVIQKQRENPEKPYENPWTIFAVIRNHFDVMVSWWFHNTTNAVSAYFGTPFEQFLYKWVHEGRWFKDGKMYWERNPYCNMILRYETLQRDLDVLLVANDLPATKLQVHNVSMRRKGRDFRTFYSAKSIQFMYDVFGAEMEELGYGAN